MIALVLFLSYCLEVPSRLGYGMGRALHRLGQPQCEQQRLHQGPETRKKVKKHLCFLLSPSSKSVNWLQSSCLLMSGGKPGGSIPLKSWQTAGIFGSCQILWALGGWSNQSITINCLSHNWPAFCLHDLYAVLDAVGVTVLSPRQHHGLIAGEKCACLWLQKPWEGSRIANQLQIFQNTA